MALSNYKIFYPTLFSVALESFLLSFIGQNKVKFFQNFTLLNFTYKNTFRYIFAIFRAAINTFYILFGQSIYQVF